MGFRTVFPPNKLGITRVQFKATDTTTSTSATSLAVTMTGATVSGNVVIITLNTVGNADLKITSAHGVFSKVTPSGFDGTTANTFVQIWYGIMFGADTVITIAGSTGAANIAPMAVVAVEYSGLNIIPDQSIPSVANGTGTTPTTGALTNADANALFVGAIGQKLQSATENTSWASAPSSPFAIVGQITTDVNTSATSDRSIAFLEAIVTTSASRTASVTGSSVRYAGVLAAFHEIGSMPYTAASWGH